MSDFDNESVNFFDDDGSLIADELGDDLDSPRPAKRRRLEDGNDEDDHEGSISSVNLPLPDQSLFPAQGDKGSGSKYKIFIPKRTNIQENIFVTQLTQPPSSPERIRGPRWKKPDPQPPKSDTARQEYRQEDDDDDYDDDDDLRAAIAASLESFQEEGSPRNTGNSTVTRDFAQQPVQSATRGQNAGPVDSPFDIGDIPEGAFDSSPSLSPPARPVQNHFNATPTIVRPGGLRQATLFDMVGRNLDSATQVEVEDSSALNPHEPRTHHKLDREALSTWVYPTNLGRIRDYQFNITQKGLFHNLLVALPTGLGKTFIAATVMLNWFRWTKNAQIIFVAPTKPLVAQQISACFEIAGIPRSQTTMLTGEAAPGIRAEEWQKKRVFFMTPQTVINDLKTGIADPKRIVLLVVDEAHRATGGYAYVEVVKFLRRYNQSFRVLALTATPGSTLESVQAVIDGLDISKVEIRTEQSLDIREYVHSRNIEVETFENSDEMNLCMDLFSATLQPLVDQLRTLNAYWGRDPTALTPYGLTKARQQWMASDAGRNASFGLKGKVNAIFTLLASLAHGIDLLKYHGITPFYRHLAHFQSNGGNGKYQREVVNDDNFKKLMNHLEPWTKNPEFIGHPKLEHLKQVVLNHFMDAGDGLGNGEQPSQSSTKVMIFVHFRDSAEEVTRVLKRYEPMIRPHVFVGQTSAKGSDGMDQKTQLSVVEKFKKGTYNTIVATSIGEEGLDIGEVDLIVCYDSSASPIRMLQRMGRTGRKRAGNIALLLMRGKEEESYVKAKDNYEKMQQLIASGSRFTFHRDRSPRILPPDVKPVPDKRIVDIPPENSQTSDLPEPKKRARPPKRPPKKFHMPDNVETGFTRASRLAEGNAGKKAKGAKDKNSKRRIRTPTPEPVEIPALEEVLLTPAQQRELEIRYRNIGGTTPQVISLPRNDAFPRLQLVARPTKMVKHGSLTRRMIDTLQKMGKSSVDCEDRYMRILARESAILAARPRDLSEELPETDSIASMPQRVESRLSPLPKRTDPVPDFDKDYDDSQRSLTLSQWAEQAQKPFYVSQVSGIDDVDMNDDLPDVTTLIDGPTERKPARRRNRVIVEDDSDEWA